MPGKYGPPFYTDPASDAWEPPNLVGALMATPATDRIHPLERQATIVLAWLIHHSSRFASEVLALFFADAPEASAAVESASRIGARAWGTLRPTPPTGSLFPDISIAGTGQSFELLIEMKIGASIHGWETSAGTLHQPDAYIRSWQENYDRGQEARVRMVGTLTLAGPGVQLAPVPMRARDVTWTEVRSQLGALLEEGIEPSVAAVAIDFAAAMDELILIKRGRSQTDDPDLAWGYDLLSEMAPKLASVLRDGECRARPSIFTDYISAYIYFSAEGDTQRLWLAVTPKGARYNVPGAGLMLWVAEPTDTRYPAGLALRFGQARFEPPHGVPFPSLRRGLEIQRIQNENMPSQAEAALEWLVTTLEPTGILHTR